jgi:hypothetical protein
MYKALVVLLLLCSIAKADVTCDGVDDILSTSAAVSTFISNSTGTIAVWFTSSSPSEGAYTILVGDNQEYLALYISTSSGVTNDSSLNYSGNAQQVVSTTHDTNTWTSLVWVHSGGNLYLYKNGDVISSTASGTTDVVTNIVNACRSAFSSAVNGRVAEIAFFNVALSDNEIAAYGKGRIKGLFARTPTVYWSFDQCAEGAAGNSVAFVDRTGGGNSLTADDGANNTGMTCGGSQLLSYTWGG